MFSTGLGATLVTMVFQTRHVLAEVIDVLLCGWGLLLKDEVGVLKLFHLLLEVIDRQVLLCLVSIDGRCSSESMPRLCLSEQLS